MTLIQRLGRSRFSQLSKPLQGARHFQGLHPKVPLFHRNYSINNGSAIHPTNRRPWSTFKLRFFIAVPVGGLALFLLQRDETSPASILSSPRVIPCHRYVEVEQEYPLLISSPDEEDRSLLSRVCRIWHVYFWEPLLTARRFIHLAFIFIPVILASPMLLVGQAEDRFLGDGWGAEWWYRRLVWAMETAGPTFIKLAQWAASRADLFPPLFCEYLGAMHSSGTPHSIHHTRRVVETVFQRPFNEVFEEFDERPIGVGAVAQVYKATLRRDLIPPSYLKSRKTQSLGPAALAPVLSEGSHTVPSAAVAIKVLHPKVSKLISRDLTIMRIFANAISLVPGMHWISLPEEVEVFGGMMNEQIDLRNEARNLLTFESNFAKRRAPVTFPRPLSLFSSRDVLIEEFEDALPLKAFLQNGGGPYDDQIAELGLDAFLNMLLLDNFVHSDLHPGNIMIKFYKPPSSREVLSSLWASFTGKKQPENSMYAVPADQDPIVDELRKAAQDPDLWRTELQLLAEQGYQPEIVFIDTGLVTSLNELDRKNFLDLFRAIAEFDGYRAGKLMVERCRTPHLAIDTETFALKMQHLVLSVKRKTFSLGAIKISDILRDVLKAVRDHHVKMEADFINTVLSVLLLEGIGRQLDPGLDLFKSSLPILRQLGRQMATSECHVADLPRSNLGAYIKLMFWMEARAMASSAVGNFDDLIRYDWIMPNV